MRVSALALAGFLALVAGPTLAGNTVAHIDTSGVNMQPSYPVSALKGGERGAVVLRVGVSRNGIVTQIRPLQTSGFDDLDKAAIEGVMRWRFVPATKDGAPIDGDANVAIAFEPPGSTTPAEQLKPAGDYLPDVFRIEAARGDFEEQAKSAPCANGRIESTPEFLHANGPAASKWKPGVTIWASKGKESVGVQMVGAEFLSPPAQRFQLVATSNDAQHESILAFSRLTPFGVPETLSLTWNSAGLVTATVGGLESHQFQLSSAPDKVGFAMSSGAARFQQSWLACYPDQVPAG